MINVQDIRKGMVFKFEGDLWTCMFMQHVSPGKGNSKEFNFRSGEKLDNVDIFERKCTYSYKEANQYVFMDNESFEQYTVEADLCEDVEHYVVLNGDVNVSLYDGKVLSVNPPNFVVLKVIQADNAVKGDTATKASKYAELETGYKLLVPLFIKDNEMLKIDTRTGEYLERVNS